MTDRMDWDWNADITQHPSTLILQDLIADVQQWISDGKEPQITLSLHLDRARWRLQKVSDECG